LPDGLRQFNGLVAGVARWLWKKRRRGRRPEQAPPG
jgi:hypothetical protein